MERTPVRALADFLQTDRTPDRICVVDRSAWEKLLPYLRGYTTEEGENRILFEDPVTSVEVPYTSLLTAAVIDGILARYPFLKSGEIGKSVMGKPISVSGDRKRGERGILQRIFSCK